MSRVGLFCGGQEKVNEAGTLGEEPVSWKASGVQSDLLCSCWLLMSWSRHKSHPGLYIYLWQVSKVNSLLHIRRR